MTEGARASRRELRFVPHLDRMPLVRNAELWTEARCVRRAETLIVPVGDVLFDVAPQHGARAGAAGAALARFGFGA